MSTKNLEKYNFADFTISHYEEILEMIKQNYIISQYHNFKKDQKFAIVRHDIDFSPHRALRVAQIETQHDICSTYFVHIHNEYYNFFESAIREIILSIIELGHDLGVHFDTHYYGITTEDQIIEKLTWEKDILENELKIAIKTFSFHNTNPFVLSCQKDEYAGLLNTYSSYFQKEVPYCSYSNGYWRYQRMYDVISKAEAPCLHLLTHPEWWQEEPMSPWQRIKRSINGRAQRNMEEYVELLRINGNKNIDWP
jgi:hypothetical protein